MPAQSQTITPSHHHAVSAPSSSAARCCVRSWSEWTNGGLSLLPATHTPLLRSFHPLAECSWLCASSRLISLPETPLKSVAYLDGASLALGAWGRRSPRAQPSGELSATALSDSDRVELSSRLSGTWDVWPAEGPELIALGWAVSKERSRRRERSTRHEKEWASCEFETATAAPGPAARAGTHWPSRILSACLSPGEAPRGNQDGCQQH